MTAIALVKNSKKTICSAVASLIVAAGLSQAAMAAEVSSNLETSATVTANCTLGTTPVAFGNTNVISGSDTAGTGSITVTCTSGTAWTASADAGTGTGATRELRKMANGGNLLNYVLYTDSGRTSIWGDGVDGTTMTIGDTGTGTAQTKTIYGSIPAGQTNLPAGSYADTVSVTVTY